MHMNIYIYIYTYIYLLFVFIHGVVYRDTILLNNNVLGSRTGVQSKEHVLVLRT